MQPVVLLTNLVLAERSGTEVFTEMLADGLRRAGCRVVVHAPLCGPQAAAMRERGFIVVDRIAAVPVRPDVIHGHHLQPMLAALVAFPGVPGLFLCHDASAANSRPPRHPGLRRWLAVDALCRDRLVSEGVPRETVGVLPNPIDLRRLVPREPLPPRPRRALAYTKNVAHLPALRLACEEAGLELHELGRGAARFSDVPEKELATTDLVFATGRAALEASAAGAAVVVSDARGHAGFLTEETARAWLPWNLGRAILVHRPDANAFRAAIAAYDPGAATAVTAMVREAHDLDAQVARLIALYAGMIAEAPADHAAEAAAAAAAIEDLVPSPDRFRPWIGLAREGSRGSLPGLDLPDRLAWQMGRLAAAVGGAGPLPEESSQVGIGGPAPSYGPSAVAHLLALFGLPTGTAAEIAARCPDWRALATHLRREHGLPSAARAVD